MTGFDGHDNPGELFGEMDPSNRSAAYTYELYTDMAARLDLNSTTTHMSKVRLTDRIAVLKKNRLIAYNTIQKDKV